MEREIMSKENPKLTRLNCTICNSEFESRRAHKKYCSPKCSKKSAYGRTKFNIKKVCENCNKEFGTSKHEAKYCSIACSNNSRGNENINKICGTCNKEFVVEYKDRDRKFCSQSCSAKMNSGILGTNGFKSFDISGDNNPNFGKKPWTYGLTKETDERIREAGNKISKVLKKKFENGEISNVGENNPMFGKKGEDSPIYGIKRSKETKELMSEIKAQNWIDGKYDNVKFGGSYIKGEYFSFKMNQNFKFRSSWEEIAFKWLDDNINVFQFYTEPFSIKYWNPSKETHSNYIPDILITFIDGRKFLIEIKPRRFHDTEKNQAKFKAAQEYCDNKGWIFEVWDESKINSIVI